MFSRIVGLFFEAFVCCSETYRRRLVEKCRVELTVNGGWFLHMDQGVMTRVLGVI